MGLPGERHQPHHRRQERRGAYPGLTILF